MARPSPPCAGDFPLPAEAARDLACDGHLTLRGVLAPAEVAQLRAAVLRAVARVPALVPTAAEGDAYARAFAQHTNLWRVDADVARFTLSPRLGNLAARLLGVRAVRLYHDQALIKQPGGGPTPWHQDKHYWPIDRDMLTLWLPLVDVTEAMGELRFARGTHRALALTAQPISADSQRELESLIVQRGDQVVATGPMSAGDASAHLAWTLHGAGANQTKEPRAALAIIYMPDGARVLEPTNDGQRTDLATWLPGLHPGDLAATDLNPICSG
jgi:ectoine hydroxylase-related dioxygenase (phytanoyl-CoA dioxygenase family)